MVVLFLQVCRLARHLLLCGKVGIQCSLWKLNFQYIFRKKYSHVSALHVIHHSTLPWLSWWGPKWVLTDEIKTQRLFQQIKSHKWWGPKWVLPFNSQSQAQRSSQQIWQKSDGLKKEFHSTWPDSLVEGKQLLVPSWTQVEHYEKWINIFTFAWIVRAHNNVF